MQETGPNVPVLVVQNSVFNYGLKMAITVVIISLLPKAQIYLRMNIHQIESLPLL